MKMIMENKFAIIFIWGFLSMFLLPFPKLFCIHEVIYIIVSILLVIPYKNIKEYIKFKQSYVLNNEERPLWNNIQQKAINGWIEYCKQTEVSNPWTQPLSKEEYELLDKIHAKYYGEDWYITDSLGGTQCTYIMFKDIEDKVR